MEPGLAVDDQGPGLALDSRATKRDDGGGVWRTEVVTEGRAGDGDLAAGVDVRRERVPVVIVAGRRLERAVDITVDLGGEALRNIGGRHAEEVVDGSRLHRGRDPRVVRAFEGGVVHRLDDNLLRLVPVGCSEGQGIASDVTATGRYNGSGCRCPVDRQEPDLGVERKVNLDLAGGSLGQRHPVVVLLELGRCAGATLGNDGLVDIRDWSSDLVVGRDQHGRCIVIDYRRHHPEHREAIVGTAILRTRPLLSTMHDAVAIGALRQRILSGKDVDRLRAEPVAAGERERHAVFACFGDVVARSQPETLAARLLHALAQ